MTTSDNAADAVQAKLKAKMDALRAKAAARRAAKKSQQ
jgi:hypothetical protein